MPLPEALAIHAAFQAQCVLDFTVAGDFVLRHVTNIQRRHLALDCKDLCDRRSFGQCAFEIGVGPKRWEMDVTVFEQITVNNTG